jgi:plastocyanin
MRHFLVLLSILSTLGQASAGTVWGTVTPGEAPPAAPVHPDTCFWRLGSGHPSPADWGQMFVVLEGEKAGLAKTAEEPANEILLEGYEILPSLTVVTAGSTIRFKNQSPRIHSCIAEGPNGFQFSDLKTGATHEQRFLDEGVVDFHCHQYPFMRAKILVVASPLHAEVET